ncbi:MAG: sulfite oxidase-like oxidoreductase [Desulfurococcales archaeon]|jgi:DMSO/TMAO reductase YedYZ molybdopterin-dependent catalytic subunit|nr:sulfite oxidase-like oxidoreductase [Desulfurococcales archaeon]
MSGMMTKQVPPGQRYIPRFIIYAEFGIPKIDIDRYRLKIDGLVDRKLEFSYEELQRLADVEYVSDFHCVTGWSVADVKWRGVSLSKIMDMAGVKNDAKWLYTVSLDGYTAILPIEDAKDPRAIVAIEINGKPLSKEQGYPARIFIPHLYGWKGAKWVEKLIFIDHYVDGYWEERGYHERGNVWIEERFKGYSGRHVRRRVAGFT